MPAPVNRGNTCRRQETESGDAIRGPDVGHWPVSSSLRFPLRANDPPASAAAGPPISAFPAEKQRPEETAAWARGRQTLRFFSMQRMMPRSNKDQGCRSPQLIGSTQPTGSRPHRSAQGELRLQDDGPCKRTGLLVTDSRSCRGSAPRDLKLYSTHNRRHRNPLLVDVGQQCLHSFPQCLRR